MSYGLIDDMIEMRQGIRKTRRALKEIYNFVYCSSISESLMAGKLMELIKKADQEALNSLDVAGNIEDKVGVDGSEVKPDWAR